MTAQTNIYYTEKMKTFRTKMQFSQQLNELGIKVGDVLKSDFRFIKLIKKRLLPAQKWPETSSISHYYCISLENWWCC